MGKKSLPSVFKLVKSQSAQYSLYLYDGSIINNM